ncbi:MULTISPECIES: phosphatase PAP2 family protein [Bacillaceae]|uniref:Phosphatase PAP2 family protein n=1 Tax=Evansella alkalicola TaxID=745819 RepID=A0ABS6JZE7_9BACI|nr:MULTISPECIES: phosphatase PAP2 family protein [Bacillaceae]MBU9723466.1 phosphatase PAP2 family protein [Bacillus alkalicola]
MNRVVTWLVTSDEHLFHFVNQNIKCRIFDAILPKITHLGGATFSLSSLLLIMLLANEIVRFWGIQALISLVSSHLLIHFIKKAYCRQRPYTKLAHVNLCSRPLKDYSFPSGHTTAVFSIIMVFCIHLPYLSILLMPLAFLIGLSRVYLGLHYPTDCIIGACIGTLSAILVIFGFSFYI